jgi:TRAP-type C4-dicarboxylate transport system permease small subunit
MSSNRFLRAWDALETYAAGLLGAAALALAFYQVVMRYLFNNAPEGAEEGVLYLVIWAVFIISSRLVRDDEHVGADFLAGRLPVPARRVLAIATTALALAFCAVVAWYGFQIVDAALTMDERSTTRMRFPMWIAYLAVPTGSILIGLSCVYRLDLLVRRFTPALFAAHIVQDVVVDEDQARRPS